MLSNGDLCCCATVQMQVYANCKVQYMLSRFHPSIHHLYIVDITSIDFHHSYIISDTEVKTCWCYALKYYARILMVAIILDVKWRVVWKTCGQWSYLDNGTQWKQVWFAIEQYYYYCYCHSRCSQYHYYYGY